jgi:LuxR family maltose regulon positive regulatory protein
MTELLSTKLYIPRPRSNLVSRPRLTDFLNVGLDRKLTLIAAPAGFGKTTLLSEWIPQSPRCVTWLSLDEGDNDPARFWAYFIAALQMLNPDIGMGAQAWLQSSQRPDFEQILTMLINEIAAFPDAFAQVFDDYHLIDNPEVDRGLAFLLAHQPPNMHLVINSRADPDLPLSRLRARGQLVELRAADLRFTLEEASLFLNQAMGLDLSQESVEALEQRTEGWITGLQLAALSMQGSSDVDGFIRAFTGSNRYIVNYLIEEVLNQRPEGTLDFLLQTSILDQMCGSLCEAVTGQADGGGTLTRLEQAHLLTMPLDDEGTWYRYHHLFAEVLQARLRQSQPDLVAELHRRASEWYEAEGSLNEAIRHAFAAGDVVRAAELIERERWTLLGRGEANTLRSWLDEMPVEVVSDRPGLSLAYAWIFTLRQQAEAIEPRLQEVEEALDANASQVSDQAAPSADAMRGEIATLRAGIARIQSDIPRAIALCRSALKLLPEDNPMMLGFATYFLGHGERRSGRMLEAEEAFVKATSLGLQSDNLLLALYALANLSNVRITMGRLREAAETSQRIIQITSERGRQAWPVAGLAHYGLSQLYYEWDDLDTAERYSRLGIESGQRGGLIGLEISCRSVLGFTLQARHDLNGADQMLQKIAAIRQRHYHPIHAARAEAWEAHLRLRQGRSEQAARWAETCGLGFNDAVLPYAREAEYLTLARVLIGQRHSGAVLELLGRLLQAAEADQRAGSLIQILVLKALALETQGDLPGALESLERALALAEPEGYVRTFLDEGEPMRLLIDDFRLAMAKRKPENPRLSLYVDKLLSAFAGARLESTSDPTSGQEPATSVLVDPLSDREVEVLRLIRAGFNNQEIAARLVIATSTVKTHINNLYGKIGVHSRTQAVATAEDLGILADDPQS